MIMRVDYSVFIHVFDIVLPNGKVSWSGLKWFGSLVDQG